MMSDFTSVFVVAFWVKLDDMRDPASRDPAVSARKSRERAPRMLSSDTASSLCNWLGFLPRRDGSSIENLTLLRKIADEDVGFDSAACLGERQTHVVNYIVQ